MQILVGIVAVNLRPYRNVSSVVNLANFNVNRVDKKVKNKYTLIASDDAVKLVL